MPQRRGPSPFLGALTDVAVLAKAAGEERHGGEEPQGLLDHALQELELLQVLGVYRPVGLTYDTINAQTFTRVPFR